MKKIGIVTATRAEYGLLLPVIEQLRQLESDKLKVELIVTGTHLSEQYGYTIDEIYKSGVRIDHIVSIPVNSFSECDISDNQAATLKLFTSLFIEQKYDGIVILGDRYEMLAIAIAAGNTRTPIFHLCGGDTTEGAIDEWIRHSITKMSYMHFPTNDESYRRVIQLGEQPDRVFNYGSTSIDNVLKRASMDKVEALDSLDLPDCKYAIGTYHPVTMDGKDIKYIIECFTSAIKECSDIQFIITKANADQGGANINAILEAASSEISNLHLFSSLGVVRYLSLMKNAEFVIGNSSSGIIETPAFKIPTINIGDRQRGRLQAESIINCGEDTQSIADAIKEAKSEVFRNKCKLVVSPYGDGHAAEKIASKIYETMLCDNIDLKKKFYNIGD